MTAGIDTTDRTEPELDTPSIQFLRALYEREGELTAESVLEAAKPKSSPIHNRFEWDDSVAAHEYRLEQARGICRVTVIVNDMEVRAFPFVPSVGSFIPYDKALADVDWSAEIIERFRKDAEAFAARYSAHSRLSGEYAAWVAAEAKRTRVLIKK